MADIAAQRRLITQANSKLTKVKIVDMMQNEWAWSSLPRNTRERLYALLPEPRADEAAHDPDVHPLKTHLKKWIERALVEWQDDLRDGRETKKFRSHKVTTRAEDMPLEDDDAIDDAAESEESDYDKTVRAKKKQKRT